MDHWIEIGVKKHQLAFKKPIQIRNFVSLERFARYLMCTRIAFEVFGLSHLSVDQAMVSQQLTECREAQY